jgi:Raf kinase inhibitor-like YbhB/YbcL family protein
MGFALSDISLTSTAFDHHGKIPTKHTGEGEDVSPALSWSNVPEGTESFAIFCHDPDAPLLKPGTYGFTHWVLYNLPAATTSLDEGSSEGTPGVNDFGNQGYGGPMPPEGHGRHHYYFWVLALDKQLNLESGLNLEQFLEKVEPNVIGMNRLIGTYKRG